MPPGRDLTQPELAEFVAALAAAPSLWSPLVRHDPLQRIYEGALRRHALGIELRTPAPTLS